MAIDFSKPVQTWGGRKVRILCTDGPDPRRPIVGFVEDCTHPFTWTAEGMHSEYGGPSASNLINAPERVERWVNINDPRRYHYAEREQADEGAGTHRVGVIRITYEDDRPVSVALEDV